MKLNCDLGEGLDDVDAAVMPLIDMASIACGGHTGDKGSMTRAITLAKQHSVEIGAHPSYPDHKNFGRKSMNMPGAQLVSSISEQIDQLQNLCHHHGVSVDYIKPHGALYNDLVTDTNKLSAMIAISDSYGLPLLLLAPINNPTMDHSTQNSPPQDNISSHTANQPTDNSFRQLIAKAKIPVLFEAFADRAYTDSGHLVARQYSHSVHSDIETVLEQAKNLNEKKGLWSESKHWLNIHADSLCVHSDSLNALEAIQKIRTVVKN